MCVSPIRKSVLPAPDPLTLSAGFQLPMGPAMYPVKIVLDQGNLAIRLAEVIEWFDECELGPGKLQYSMAADHVELRIDFDYREEAVAFAEEFSGSVRGASRATLGYARIE